MLKTSLCFLFIIVAVYGNGELTILHHPKSLVFKGHQHLRESTLKEVYSTALGFSSQEYSNWNGLFLEDPFNLAECLVTVVIDGVSKSNFAKGHHFVVQTDDSDENIYSSLERRVLEHYPEANSHLIAIDLSDELEKVQSHDVFKNIKSDSSIVAHKHLSRDVEEHLEFLKEMDLLNAIMKSVKQGILKRDNIPDIFWLKVSTLHPLVDLYGQNSTQVKEAEQILNEAILELNAAFVKAYNGKVLVSILASDSAHSRHTRSLLAADDPPQKEDHNIAKQYSKDYPVIFNIILWFGVAMVFTLLAICIAIADMDPGRDSIIYRMTSTRMKKDN